MAEKRKFDGEYDGDVAKVQKCENHGTIPIDYGECIKLLDTINNNLFSLVHGYPQLYIIQQLESNIYCIKQKFSELVEDNQNKNTYIAELEANVRHMKQMFDELIKDNCTLKARLAHCNSNCKQYTITICDANGGQLIYNGLIDNKLGNDLAARKYSILFDELDIPYKKGDKYYISVDKIANIAQIDNWFDIFEC